MTLAVEERTRSERMKTELITNVSHEIKTPLTSIINYSDLIEKEPCENPTIIEYAGVLHRQSDRLKRLIDDLVEASKASTGNLEVLLALNISADELMERFVRGDASRNTEGNGLGLSIAKSLTGLQNGSLQISIDGDFFKVELRFPLIQYK